MITGRIIRGVGGFYTLEDEKGAAYICKARGRFRRDGVKPVVGDMVTFEPGAEGDEGFIAAILDRKNEMVRPALANIDRFVMVIAAQSPQPDLVLADRLMLCAAMMGIEQLLCVNKCDLSLGTYEMLEKEYAYSGIKVIKTSAHTGFGLDELKVELVSGISAFAGQSGAGKSSLINALCPNADMEIGDISRIERGRHTTRHSELIKLGPGGWIIDTPGFSLFELESQDPSSFMQYYEEMLPYEGECRFLSCQHLSEPGCAVRAAGEEKGFSARLERYSALYNEAKQKWEKRYD